MADTIDVEVLWPQTVPCSPAHRAGAAASVTTTVHSRNVQLPPGATIATALQACGVTLSVTQACGVWGRSRPEDWPLQPGDRVEVYQPLKVDPKVARRERFAQQGARSSGLFASRRPNSKAGY